MPTLRQRRQVFYGVFATIFFLAAIGLLYLVWITVRGIPLDEATRVGEQQLRLLKLATGRFLDKIDWVGNTHRDLVARIPNLATRATLESSDPAVNLPLSRLEGLLGAPPPFRIYRLAENGTATHLFPPRTAAVPIDLPAERAKQLVDSSRSIDDTRIMQPETIERSSGKHSFLFVAPIRPSGSDSFAGAVCLETPVVPLLAENLTTLSGKHTFFFLEWPEDASVRRNARPTLLFMSSDSVDEPRSAARLSWRERFLDALAENSSEIRDDADRRGYLLPLPSPNEGDRLEIVSHVSVWLRWGVCMSTSYDSIHTKAPGQRLLLITLGSVALGILVAAVVFFVVQVVQRERELKAVEASYQGLFAENPTAMLVLDEVGRIVDCNFSAARLMAMSPKDAKGLKLADVFESEAVDPLWKALSEDENLHAVDVRWKRRVDKAESLAEVWGRRIGDRWMLMAHDVGDRRELERQMARLKRMDSMGALASTLAHDFNNLLGQIQIMVSNLRADLPANSEAAADLGAVEGKVEDASQLVAGILAFRENVIAIEPVRLEPVLKDFVGAQKRILPESIRLTFTVDSDLPSVWIVPAALRRVLDNLCKNAADAMPEGGELSIRCGRRLLAAADSKQGLAAGVYAVIEVSDTGLGVSEAAFEKLFQPFFTTKAGGRGTGLGLWTVYKILRQLGGGIHVQSRVGQGTRFEVLLPHHPPTAEHSWIRKEKFELQ